MYLYLPLYDNNANNFKTSTISIVFYLSVCVNVLTFLCVSAIRTEKGIGRPPDALDLMPDWYDETFNTRTSCVKPLVSILSGIEGI